MKRKDKTLKSPLMAHKQFRPHF